MLLIEASVSKDYDKIAAIEKAIIERYGKEAVQNPKANWDENKEKEYLEQMRELYKKNVKNEAFQEKIMESYLRIRKK